GTEILMKNFTDPNDGMVRQGFPGGWPEDTLNKFDRAQRTAAENEAYDFVKRLAQWRQKTPAVTQGKLMQFVPDKGVYTYFRYTEDQAVMVLMNGQKEARVVDLKRFAERTSGYATGKDVVSGESYPVTPTDTVTVPAKTTLILELAR
ncbi:MAG: cyclomaltodextrinase C-terminal domain-containing protein, partial [Bacteroidota bacterium]